MTTIGTPPADTYRARSTDFAAREAVLSKRFDRVSNLRLLAFLLAALGGALALWSRSPLPLLPALVCLVAFAVLVRNHGRLKAARRRAAVLREINDEAGLRLARDWDRLPLRHAFDAGPAHPYAADLDILGRASLFQLLDTTATPMGAATLRNWLLAPARPEEPAERQAAAAELSPLLELRQELELCGRLASSDRGDPESFLEWAESPPSLSRRRTLLVLARLSPVLFWLSVGAWAAHLTSLPVWLPFFCCNLLLLFLLGTGTEAALGKVRSSQGAFLRYAEALGIVAGGQFSAPLLVRLQGIVDGEQPAARALRRLERLSEFAIPTASVAYFALQVLFLWNVHVLWALERWQAQAAGRARGWLTALGDIEALSALAGLAHAHPGWAYPELDPAAKTVSAERLGHPLLAPQARVDNDLTVGPPGSFLLITGSNMSGKSTLLRALGVNAVLAAAGGPVCASCFRLPSLRVWTSMRVVDSLEHGVSHFLAEVRRLKQIVQAASELEGKEVILCYLVDEMLQGTNTAERRVAARSVIRHLVGKGAIGAVSSHDLTLADSPEMAAIARPLHFKETVTGDAETPGMTFDYLLRPGLATSTNALRLMRLVGLEVDGGDS